MNDYKELIENLRMAGKSVESADGSFDIYLLTAEKCQEIADAIEQLVKARNTAEPVRHAHWVAYEDNKQECYCSNCEFPAGLNAYGYHTMPDPYCRFCGAKMDEGSE